MPLTQIDNPNPITIAASEEKTFPNAYIVGLHLTTTDTAGTRQPLRVTLRPYNQAAAELDPNQSHNFTLDIKNIWTEAARVPLLAQTIGSIISVVALLVQERDLAENISKADETQRPALEAQLSNVRSEMGIQ
jgi:hypothetical protein